MGQNAGMTIYFYSQTDPFGEFSNFAPFGVEMDGVWWRTVEHYFQAMKFDDGEYRERIRKASTPKDAKALGRTRDIPIRSDWDVARDAVVLEAVRRKQDT